MKNTGIKAYYDDDGTIKSVYVPSNNDNLNIPHVLSFKNGVFSWEDFKAATNISQVEEYNSFEEISNALGFKDKLYIDKSLGQLYAYNVSTNVFYSVGSSIKGDNGLSAYEVAVTNGYIGSEKEWLETFKEPAIEAANSAYQAIESIDNRFPEKLLDIKQDITEVVSNKLGLKIDKPMVISNKERVVGNYKLGIDNVDIYENSIILKDLPTIFNAEKEYVISKEPLGYGLFFNIESFVASSGKSITSSFMNNRYEITDYYINDSLETIIKVKCLKHTEVSIDGTLTIKYCKFFGDVIEIDVKLPSNIDKTNISLTFPKLKFNKKLIFSYITDDSYSIFQYIFSPINKRLVAKRFGNHNFYHYGMEGKENFDNLVTESYTLDSPLQCTDGAGIYRRYASTVSIWAEKLVDQYVGFDVGMNWPYMSEKEFKMFYDFGFMVGYHDLKGYSASNINQEKFDLLIDDAAVRCKNFIGITPKLMVEPNGDNNYLEYSKDNSIVQFTTAQNGTYTKFIYPYKKDYTLNKHDISILRVFAYGNDLNLNDDNPAYSADILAKLDSFNNATNTDEIYWLIGSAHRSAHWETTMLKDIYNKYGDKALDNLWMPTLDEMYEYWFMINNTLHIKSITEDGIKYKLYVPKLPNFFYRDLSIMLSGIDSLDNVDVTSSNNVYGTSFAINNNELLVNLNFDTKLMERVNKYLDIFESDNTKKYAYDDALYFIQQLKKGLKEPYMERLNVGKIPPTLGFFGILNSDNGTLVKTVELLISCIGNVDTIEVSENANFSNPTIYTISDAYYEYELSSGYGVKTLYVRLKNEFGYSNVLSDTIEYKEAPIVLIDISTDNITSTNDINVSFNYGGIPTHYRISEENIENSEWIVFSDDVKYTLTSNYGDVTIYAQLKNNISTSNIVDKTISYVNPDSIILNNITIDNGNLYTNSKIINISIDSNKAFNKYKVWTSSEVSDDIEWKDTTSNEITYTIDTTLDFKLVNIFVMVAKDNNISNIVDNSITFVSEISDVGIILNNNILEHSGLTIPVNFECNVSNITHYRLSTANNLTEIPWVEYSPNISYTFDNIGEYTLYGQVKNQVSESIVVSSPITILSEQEKIILGFSNTQLNNNNLITHNNEICNNVKVAHHSNYNNLELRNTKGEQTSAIFCNKTNLLEANEVFTSSGYNNFASQSTAIDNDIDYPLSLMGVCNSHTQNLQDGSKKMRIPLILQAGSYKVRIMMSPGDNFLFDDTYIPYSFYGAFVGNTQLAKEQAAPLGFTGKGNNSVFNSTLEFTISEESQVDFAAWQEGSKVQYYRPGINLLEITKL